jgi:hypothetical protein
MIDIDAMARSSLSQPDGHGRTAIVPDNRSCGRHFFLGLELLGDGPQEKAHLALTSGAGEKSEGPHKAVTGHT